MKPVDYLHLQMRLEGILACDGNLIRRAHTNVEDFPLVLQALLKTGETIVYFDDTIPSELLKKLTAEELQPFEIRTLIEIFTSCGISTKVGRFRTYTFPEGHAVSVAGNVKCYRHDHPKVITFGFAGLTEEVYAIERNGVIVSACVSSRQNAKSAESWVFTHPDHRGEGLAQQVVTVWAWNVLQEGLIPFYSHAVENTGSAKVARKLKLVHLYDEIVIERDAN